MNLEISHKKFSYFTIQRFLRPRPFPVVNIYWAYLTPIWQYHKRSIFRYFRPSLSTDDNISRPGIFRRHFFTIQTMKVSRFFFVTVCVFFVLHIKSKKAKAVRWSTLNWPICENWWFMVRVSPGQAVIYTKYGSYPARKQKLIKFTYIENWKLKILLKDNQQRVCSEIHFVHFSVGVHGNDIRRKCIFRESFFSSDFCFWINRRIHVFAWGGG